MSDLVDLFVETWMGKGNKLILNDNSNMPLKNISDNEGMGLLKTYQKYINTDLKNIIGSKDDDLKNIQEEMLTNINHTLYLFTLK